MSQFIYLEFDILTLWLTNNIINMTICILYSTSWCHHRYNSVKYCSILIIFVTLCNVLDSRTDTVGTVAVNTFLLAFAVTIFFIPMNWFYN